MARKICPRCGDDKFIVQREYDDIITINEDGSTHVVGHKTLYYGDERLECIGCRVLLEWGELVISRTIDSALAEIETDMFEQGMAEDLDRLE